MVEKGTQELCIGTCIICTCIHIYTTDLKPHFLTQPCMVVAKLSTNKGLKVYSNAYVPVQKPILLLIRTLPTGE